MTEQAALLALSAERDQWRAYARNLAQWMYEAGYAAGRADEAREADQAWAAVRPQQARDRPTLAELELLRWELRGEKRTRETFGQPHPADHRGQRQESAA